MAKKKNDKIEDNDDLNQENQSDFNEADDNFGLPEVDYQPLDESNTENEEKSSDIEEQESNTYSSDEESSVTNSESESQQEYIPGSYSPQEERSSNSGKIIGIIIVVLLLAAVGWYFGFHKPAQDKEKARIEKLKQEEDAAKLAIEQKAEEERLAREIEEREAARLAAEEAAKPKIGTVETISTRTGRFYVVIASDIDGDLALDYAKKLIKTGVNITIIEPYGKSKFHRIAVDNLDTWASAENRANELKSEYGESVWVIKY
jgi:cell division protein FtsB